MLNKKIPLFFIFFILNIFSSNALSIPTDPAITISTIQGVLDVEVDKTNNISHRWFSQLFGDFIIGALNGDSSGNSEASILSKVIGFSNVLAMILGLVISAYVFLNSLVETANSGEIMGKQKNGVWVTARTALGYALILPVPGIGVAAGGTVIFSPIQMIVLWFIFVGSNAGTSLWTFAVDEMKLSGLSSNYSIPVSYSLPNHIFKMAACAAIYEENTNKKVELEETTVTDIHSIDSGFTVKLEYVYKSNDVPKSSCGSVSFRTYAKIDNGTLDPKGHHKYTVGLAFNTQIKGFIKSQYKDYKKWIKHKNQFKNSFSNYWFEKKHNILEPIYIEYIEKANKTIKDYNQEIFKIYNNNPAKIKDMSDFFKSQGWGVAGMFYFNLSQLTRVTRESSSFLMASFMGAQPANAVWNGKDVNTEFMINQGLERGVTSFIVKTMAYASKNKGLAKFIHATEPQQVCFNGSNTCISDGRPALEYGTSSLAYDMVHVFGKNRYDYNGTAPTSVTGIGRFATPDNRFANLNDPFQTLTQLGDTLQTRIYNLANIASITGSPEEFSKKTKNSHNPLDWFNKESEGYKNIMSPGAKGAKIAGTFSVALFLLPITIVLSYVIPFMPILAWIQMIGVYLFNAIEALIAAPLAIILLLTPEGDGIGGKKIEQALKLLWIIVLKPSLMVMGLLASILMSSVLYGAMNYIFWGASEMNMDGFSNNIIEILSILVLYVMFTYKIAEISISIIYRLPDAITHWITSGAGADFSSNVAGDVSALSGRLNSNMNTANQLVQSMVRTQQMGNQSVGEIGKKK